MTLDLEGAVLGALVLEQRIEPEIEAELTVDLFSSRRKPLARAVLDAWRDHRSCDLVTVGDVLTRKGGGIQDAMELAKLAEAVPSAANLTKHVKLLHERGQAESSGEVPFPGLAGLRPGASMHEIETTLKAFATSLQGADSLRREAARGVAVKALDAIGIRSPARLVDAALDGRGREDRTVGLQGQPFLLNDPDPWPEVVDGAELLAEIATTVRRYVVLPDGADVAITLWVIVTHAVEAATVLAILAATSPTMRAGKTTLLEVMAAMCRRPLPASNVTPSVLFRSVERFAPTVLIDEADIAIAGNDELRGLLNAGHTRATAWILRNVGDEHEPRLFSVFCAKGIALIGKPPATIEDRSIVIPMRRKTRSEKVQRMRRGRLQEELAPIRQKAARWAIDHLDALREADPICPEELTDRAQDNWRPLIAIADLVGGPWPDLARRASLLLSGLGAEEEGTVGVQLLVDLRAIFSETGAEAIPSADVVERLVRQEDRPWPEFRRGKPITTAGLARLLRPFGIRPGQWRKGQDVVRGYRLEGLEDAFARYLPPHQTVTPVTSQQNQEVMQNFGSLQTAKCNDLKNAASPRNESVVTDVTDEKGDAWEEEIP